METPTSWMTVSDTDLTLFFYPFGLRSLSVSALCLSASDSFSGKRLINFEKYRMVASIITQLVSYQQRGYPFLPDPEIQYYLENMVILSEKQLYTYSQRVENRNTMANRRQSRLSMRITQSIVGAGFGSWRGGGRP